MGPNTSMTLTSTMMTLGIASSFCLMVETPCPRPTPTNYNKLAFKAMAQPRPNTATCFVWALTHWAVMARSTASGP